ncbi:MAG: cell surface protein SprA [Flavobacteriales bacterium]|nr:cell surface protein SprA [Flavobacteriales bacterium]
MFRAFRHFARKPFVAVLGYWPVRLFVLLALACIADAELLAADPWALVQQVDTPEIDLQYPIIDPPAPGENNTGTIDLAPPENVTNDVVYDPITGQYILQSNIGDNIQYRPPMSMSLDEYLNYDMQKSMKTFWTDKNKAATERDADKPWSKTINVRSEAFCRIFRGCNIDIRPQGSAEVTFGLNISKTENPRIPVDQRKITTFNFDQRIQLNLVGNIGEALKINTAYNTEATFDFENQVKLNYVGDEDQIVQKLEAGNVSLPLTGQLIQGSQSLFGLKTELRFGRLTATAIFSQEKGQRRNVQVAGGAQTTNFDIKADEYEANKYYFLSNYFRDSYENALRTLPLVNSGINITRIEVWITNTRFDFEQTRNAVGFTDLGEDGSPAAIAAGKFSDGLIGVVPQLTDGPGNRPSNAANSLFALTSVPGGPVAGFTNATAWLQGQGFVASRHYEKLESARLLLPSEFTVNERLGFIGLNQNLNNDEVLMVAYQYTLDGETFQVGQFAGDVSAPSALVLRLLKATITNPRIPLWDLMMKNVYSLGAFQVNREDFRLDLVYNNPATGVDINYIPRPPVATIPVIQTLGLDRLDPQNAPNPDGAFDFVDNAATVGGTINTQNGRIFFPVLEPFGSYLDRRLLEDASNSPAIRANIVFQQLYDSTKTAAQNLPELNRFRLRGSYKSASSDVISLNSVNIPQGSVAVTAGGVRLLEGQDYTVDYNLGRVKILNQGILESGTPINISLESNSLFSIQQKTLAGARLDYKVSKDLTIGGTIMNLSERPLTQKVNVGDEPISNTIVGLDANWKTESGFVTRLVDQLPFFATKEVSTVNVSAEGAYLIPGHSRAIGNSGTSYIDDFEGSVSNIDMRQQAQWFLASTPQGQTDLWNEGQFFSRANGFKRALLAWYVVDPIFFREGNLKPPIPDGTDKTNQVREILEKEVFPNRVLPTGTPSNIPVLDLAYYPNERGPYNYEPNLDPNGKLPNPADNWAGITRRVNTTDFEQSNIETIQFWMMDPFDDDAQNGSNTDSRNITGGDFYIDLGNISEDVLRDSRKSFENGLPENLGDASATTSATDWGVVPTTQSVVNAFAITQDNSYKFQDAGLDGLADNQSNFNIPSEQAFLPNALYLTDVANNVLPGPALDSIIQDPSGDRYHFFRGPDLDAAPYDILRRYKYFNGPEGNSITDEDSPEDYPTQSTTLPSTEDINQDQNLSESESYFQYKVSLRPADMVVGQNFITDRIVSPSADGTRSVAWYQFKIPIRQPDRVVNGIQDFRSIRFMRLKMKGWSQEAVLRFARLEFIRGEWRKYLQTLETLGEGPGGGDPEATLFNVAAVNIEENGRRTPINYTLPPGINQETDVSSANLRNLNEQSLQLQVCNLRDGDARAAFRNVNFDIRSYKKMQMYVHAESRDPANPIEFGDVSVFIRVGNDFDQNYYEYEVPAEPTQFSESDPSKIWPEKNNMIIEFARLNDVKIQRNSEGAPVNLRYTQLDGDRRITVKGNPNLSRMNTIMIGVRNPKKNGSEANPWNTDDATSQCVEVWVNELRLTDFDQSGGWAALARVNTTLADLGTLSVAGNYSTPFWGSIDKRVSERQRDTRFGVDVSANLEMGKFLPESSGVKVPLYLGYSEQVINPQFDPLNPDIEWEDATRALTKEERKERLKQLHTYTRRRSINVTNVHKERAAGGSGKEHFYDVENLSLSYAYGDQEYHDVNTQYENTRTYRGSLAWQHTPKPRPVKPFENVGFIGKSKWTKLIKDFNVNLGFKQLTARTSLDRTYMERLVRPNPDIVSLPPIPTYNKTFGWQSQYGFRYEITKNLKVDFNANRNAIIGEPAGRVNGSDRPAYEVWKDSVLTSIREFGLPTGYDHTVNVTYTLPLDKLPLTDWITVNTTYGAAYKWDRAPLTQDSIGNTIQNSRTISINGQLNFVNLYNKIKFLKKINDKAKGNKGGKVTPPKGKGGGSKSDSTNTKTPSPSKINPVEGFARVLMMLRTGTLTYSQNNGMLLPGWNRGPNVIGMDAGFGAPGFGFILGEQNTNFNGDIVRDFASEASGNGWLVKNKSIFTPHTQTRTENITARLALEPFKGMRIDVSANRTIGTNRNSFYRWDTLDTWRNDSPRETGNFSVSMLNWPTTFVNDDENLVNQVFENMLAYRTTISQRLGSENSFSDLPSGLPSDSVFWTGYGATNQDVVIPSFLAAYTGRDPNSVKLNPFKLLPAPNWDITYDGLTKLEFFKKLFRTFTVNHSYRSTFTIGGYQTNLFYEPGGNATDIGGNFIPEKQISVVTISEVMRPFINFDATLQNSLLAKFEYNRDRSLSLSLSNNQVTEVRGKEFVIGSGYRFKNVKFPIQIGSAKPKSDLNLRVDLSWRQNNTVIRQIQQRQNTVTAGQDIISIKTSADYVINQKLNIRAFYERVINKPVISTTFPSANTNLGISLRFTLTQ